MEILKSSRHGKIIGDFGEALVANWLSRSGFEVVAVDHTGIDIIAYHRPSDRRFGISVKSRTRQSAREKSAVIVFSRPATEARAKLHAACKAFNCEPWIAVYVEMAMSADLYLLSLSTFDANYRSPRSAMTETWKMRQKHKDMYETDPHVRHIHLDFRSTNWNWQQSLDQRSA